MMFSYHFYFVRFWCYRFLQLNNLTCCGRGSVPAIRASGFSFLLSQLESYRQYLFGLKGRKPFSHLCVYPDTLSSVFQMGCFISFQPWALVSVQCQCNTRSYDSAFFFSLGIHSTFPGSRITHFLSVLEHLPQTIGATTNGLAPCPHCQACILEIDMPSILG